MVYIIKKRIGEELYYYLNHSVRVDDKVKTLSYYLGKGPFSQSEIESLVKEKSQMILLEAEFFKVFSKRSDYKEHHLPSSFINILERLKEINRIMAPFNKSYFEKFEENLQLRYVHGSTAIEGNTMSLRDAQLILEEDTPAGNTLREMHEVLNYKELFKFIRSYRGDINLKFILKIHEFLMKNIDDENAAKDITFLYLELIMTQHLFHCLRMRSIIWSIGTTRRKHRCFQLSLHPTFIKNLLKYIHLSMAMAGYQGSYLILF